MEALAPYRLDTKLTGYMPLPRELLHWELSSTAMLIYAALLDRATLSQKNRYADDAGRVYVIYPIDKLAQTFQISDTAVKRHLKQLETKGLIRRRRTSRNAPSRIYLELPAGGTPEETFCPAEGSKTPRRTGQKVPPNNRKEPLIKSNDYQHLEEESL